MAPRTLSTMPIELLHGVVELFEGHPGDLHSLCLVSKQVSTVATTYLYRDFVFPHMTHAAAERICITLTNSKGLLPLVRYFHLGLCLRHCSENLEVAFLVFLSSFPDDCLLEFNFNGHWIRPSHQNFLWSHQQKIHDLELTLITEELLRRQIGPVLLFNSANYNRRYELQVVDSLTLHDERMGPSPVSLRVHGRLGTGLWESNIITRKKLSLVNVKHLALDDVFLEGSFLTSLPNLNHLAFRNCPAAGQCLGGFTKPIFLKTLYFFYDPTEHAVLPNLAIFLSRFRGLETLAVRDIWRYRPASGEERGTRLLATAIERHCKTLSFLLVHFNHQVHANHEYYDPILRAAGKCKKLSQLGLSMAPKQMETACRRLINQLPSLVTLRIDFEHSLSYFTMWHDTPITANRSYARLFRSIAAQTMKTAENPRSGPPRTKFALLSIGYQVSTINNPLGRSFRERMNRFPHNNHGSCDCALTFEICDGYLYYRHGSEPIRIEANEAKELVSESDIIDFRYRFFNCR